MLTNTRLPLTAMAGALFVLAACTTTPVDTNNQIETGGSGGTGAVGGEGGSGAVGGVGGEGGDGGTGGTTTCLGPDDGSGEVVAACDDLTLTPTTEGGPTALCVDGDEMFTPPGYDTCQLGYQLFHAGAWENLLGCLAEIGTNPEACEQEPVDACVTAMYANACDNETATAVCTAVNTGCVDAADDNFDYDGCVADLKPFGETGLDAYVDCQDANLDQACADIHELCIIEVSTFQ